MSQRYPSDVTDAQWAAVKDLFEPPRPKGGRPRKYPARQMLNAILYVMKQGCAWRALPGNFPPWHVVFVARQRWSEDDTLQRAMSALARAGTRP